VFCHRTCSQCPSRARCRPSAAQSRRGRVIKRWLSPIRGIAAFRPRIRSRSAALSRSCSPTPMGLVLWRSALAIGAGYRPSLSWWLDGAARRPARHIERIVQSANAWTLAGVPGPTSGRPERPSGPSPATRLPREFASVSPGECSCFTARNVRGERPIRFRSAILRAWPRHDPQQAPAMGRPLGRQEVGGEIQPFRAGRRHEEAVLHPQPAPAGAHGRRSLAIETPATNACDVPRGPATVADRLGDDLRAMKRSGGAARTERRTCSGPGPDVFRPTAIPAPSRAR
jgi:hypothetical protein